MKRITSITGALLVSIALAGCMGSTSGQTSGFGALGGAAAGAAIGSQFGEGQGQIVGTAIGSILGLGLGNEIEGGFRRNARRTQRGEARWREEMADRISQRRQTAYARSGASRMPTNPRDARVESLGGGRHRVCETATTETTLPGGQVVRDQQDICYTVQTEVQSGGRY